MKKQNSTIKTLIKTIFTLSLVIVFLMTCIVSILTVGVSMWLHTYKALTKKTLVAEITTSELKYEDDIPYFDVTYKQVQQKTAFQRIFSRGNEETTHYELTEDYKVYGDRVEVGGEIIKWNDWLNLLGLDTIYKISRLKGNYSDTELEREAERSVYDLNGGVDSIWKTLQKNEESFSFLVDSVYSSAGMKFVEDKDVKWGVYVTTDGILIDRLE
jgi:hypothetical protein